jgi:hypothetical protein
MRLYKKAACKKKDSIFNVIKIVSYSPQRPENGTIVVHFNIYTPK